MTNPMPFSIDHCTKCGEEVINAELGDPHFERQDGTPCGGKIDFTFEYKEINWSALQHG